MPVLLTSTGRIKDWKALQRLNQSTLVGRAREAGAIHYRIYRSVRDASRLLFLAEFPDDAAAREFGEAIVAQMSSYLDVLGIDDPMWEPTELEGIG